MVKSQLKIQIYSLAQTLFPLDKNRNDNSEIS